MTDAPAQPVQTMGRCLCGTSTPLAHHGLCLPCTEADIGMTLAQHRTRVNAVLAKGRKRKWQR